MRSIARRAPIWLDALRALPEWRLAHTPLDSNGREVRPSYPWWSPETDCPESPTFDAFLRSLGERFGDRVAIADYSHVRFAAHGEPERAPTLITYRNLLVEIERVRRHLLARGLGPWDHVHMCLPNRIEALTLQYAGWSIGAVVSPINPDQRGRIDDILRCADDLVSPDSPPHRLVVVDCEADQFARDHHLDPTEVVHVDRLAEGPSDSDLAPAPRFDDPVLILHTSGTTGKPKGALLSPAGLLTAAIVLEDGFAIAGDDRFLMVNPLYHINSIAFALAVFGVGARLVIPPFGLHWQVAAAERITFTSMVQRHLTPIVSPASAADRRNVHAVERLLAGGTLKWIAVGSGPLAPEIQERLLDMGILVLFRWGMSENYLGSTNMRPGYPIEYYRARLGSTGPTNPYLNLAVRGEDGAIRPRGRGRLLQRGNIFVAYSSPDANAGAFADGWHDTGDIAEINAEGHVYIVGRTKETIIRSGENIYPQDVDNHLIKHASVIVAQTVGYPEATHSEEVGAFVVVDDDRVSEREIAEHASSLGIQRRPKKLVLLAPEHERSLLRYSGPGKPQRLANQLTFWKMHFLDEAAALMQRDGALDPNGIAVAIPHGESVGLLVLGSDGHQAPGSDGHLPGISDYIVRGSRLSHAELGRVLSLRGLRLSDLEPCVVIKHHLTPEELARARELNRAGLARAYGSSTPAAS